jgi:hypothetical protein
MSSFWVSLFLCVVLKSWRKYCSDFCFYFGVDQHSSQHCRALAGRVYRSYFHQTLIFGESTEYFILLMNFNKIWQYVYFFFFSIFTSLFFEMCGGTGGAYYVSEAVIIEFCFDKCRLLSCSFESWYHEAFADKVDWEYKENGTITLMKTYVAARNNNG